MWLATSWHHPLFHNLADEHPFLLNQAVDKAWLTGKSAPAPGDRFVAGQAAALACGLQAWALTAHEFVQPSAAPSQPQNSTHRSAQTMWQPLLPSRTPLTRLS